MSSNHLTEFDVAGALLNGKCPEDLKVQSDLVERFMLVKSQLKLPSMIM